MTGISSRTTALVARTSRLSDRFAPDEATASRCRPRLLLRPRQAHPDLCRGPVRRFVSSLFSVRYHSVQTIAASRRFLGRGANKLVQISGFGERSRFVLRCPRNSPRSNPGPIPCDVGDREPWTLCNSSWSRLRNCRCPETGTALPKRTGTFSPVSPGTYPLCTPSASY